MAAADYELISTTVLGSAAASVTFSGLGTSAAAYKHLQIRGTVRDTLTTSTARLGVQLNGDTATNYDSHGLFGRGASVASFAEITKDVMRMVQDTPGGTTTANTFAGVIMDFLDFSSTTKNKTVRALGGFAANESVIGLDSGEWRSTAAVTSITLTALQGTAFATGSRFSLYGLRA